MSFVNRIGKRELGIEVFAVVFGVLLALWVDAWQENRKLAEDAAEQCERVVGEVRTNLVEILDSMKRNEEFRKHNEEITKQSGWEKDGGATSKLRWNIVAADLKASAWQIALLDTAATVMDVELLSAASNIYKHQDIYDSYVKYTIEALDGDVLFIESDVRSAFKRHSMRVMLLAGFSRQLKNDYESFLQRFATKDAVADRAK
jgi:hypothetical protein